MYTNLVHLRVKNKMKKVHQALIVISAISTLFGCAQIKTEVDGRSFETSWTSDEHNHWHACIDTKYTNIKKDNAEHTFNEEVVLPTFEEEGYTLHTCKTCGFQYKDNEMDALTKHNYSSQWSSNENTHWHACTDDGCLDIKKDEGKHTPSEWIIDEKPTTSKQGKKHKQCTICGRQLIEETINQIPDDVVDNSSLIFIELESGNYSVKTKSTSVEEIIIPSTYNGKPVTMIEKYAFGYCSSLTSIIIPDSVTSIDEFAFYNCVALTSITIPNSAVFIGNYAFSHCSSLTSTNIPDTITSIGDSVFSHCSSLTSISIPNSVTSIADYAFNRCSSLQTINFEGTSEQWNAMCKGEGWNKETSPNIVINCIGDYLSFTQLDSNSYSVKAASKLIDETIIPSTFNDKPVTKIEKNAFRECQSLISITIPNTVTYISEYTFNRCSSLRTINFEGTSEQWNAISKGEGWDDGTPTNMVINCVGDYLSFTQLDSGSYSVKAASKSVEEVGIQNKYNGKPVTMIEKDAFSDCSSLKSIIIPNTVASIGENAFVNCSSLTYVEIPNTVAFIDNYVFSHCSSLKSITIPNSVTYIGSNAFSCCPSLQTIIFDGTKEQWNAISKGADWNDETPMSTVIICVDEFAFTQLDSGSYSVKAASKLIEEVALPSTYNDKPVTTIEFNAFGFCSSLTSITIPNTVTSIGEHAFSHCSSLTSIAIPDSVTSIGKYAFSYCSSLRTINFNGTAAQWNAITKGEGWNEKNPMSTVIICVDEFAFTQLDSGSYSVKAASKLIEEVDVPSTFNGKPVTLIEKFAFRECQSLTSIIIPNSVTSIGDAAFTNCSSLTSIIIPNSVTSIGNLVFDYCSSLTSINIPNSVTSIGDAAFANCSSLTSIQIPDSVTFIGSSAFMNCSSLISISIPGCVTSIGEHTFDHCSSLKSITIPNSVTYIGRFVFRECSSLTSITIPNSVTSIADYAFNRCSSLQTINFDGTKEQWNAISKGEYWNDETPMNMVIRCTDGDIS